MGRPNSTVDGTQEAGARRRAEVNCGWGRQDGVTQLAVGWSLTMNERQAYERQAWLEVIDMVVEFEGRVSKETEARAMERAGIEWRGNVALVPGHPNLIYVKDEQGNVV